MIGIGSVNSSYTSSSDKINELFEQLASGKKINSAQDDAAGLAIADRMETQVRSLDASIRNVNDGISMTQTADSALSETTSALQSMRELAVSASNGTYSASDRASMSDEFSQLQDQVNSISSETSFNGQTLLDGSLSSGVNFQVGADSGDAISVALDSASAESIGIDSLSIDTVEGAQDAIEAIDSALSTVSDMRGDLGATQSSFEASGEVLTTEMVNTQAAQSAIEDTDYAQTVTELAKESVLEQAGVAMQVQQNNLNSDLMLNLLK